MIKVISINRCKYGSTGTITNSIASVCKDHDIQVYQAYPEHPQNMDSGENDISICSFLSYRINQKLGYLTGLNDCFSFISTRRFLNKIDKIGPDIIHIHNLHNGFINIPLLFNYIKQKKIKVIWTMHDAWPITGGCPHFISVGCNKWRAGCYKCPLSKEYPGSLIDNSRNLWNMKKNAFSKVDLSCIVTPSNWLKTIIQESFLKDKKIRVINNGINTDIFKYTKSNIKAELGTINKHMIMGASFSWNNKKGLDVFMKLADMLDDDYRIVLIGVEKEVKSILPPSIIAIGKVTNPYEMSKLYSAADVFVNPTREDTYPNVNMEAIACGTPVVTFRVGGACEMIDEGCGFAVECDDIMDLYSKIVQVCNTTPQYHNECLKRAETFDSNKKFFEYVNLYKEVQEGKI